MNKEDLTSNRRAIQELSQTGLLFALSLALSYLESFLPPIMPGLPLRYGLSNLPVMYLLLEKRLSAALGLSIVKSIFVLVTRGGMSATLSIAGGLASVLVMFTANRLSRGKISLLSFSVLGAVSHNLAQLGIITLIMNISPKAVLTSLFPYLMLIGMASGILTAFILRLIINYLPHSKTKISG